MENQSDFRTKKEFKKKLEKSSDHSEGHPEMSKL